MRFLLALLLPWVMFGTIGRPFAAVACLFLQATGLGWMLASAWAIYGLRRYETFGY